jgi:hypothetical protein
MEAGFPAIPAIRKIGGDRMRFWIECTRFETGQPIHINIALVGSMLRDGKRTVLTYVGDGQTIYVTETPADSGAASRADGEGVTPLTVIARSKATKQSILSPRCGMDCFAALAMTAEP